MSIPRWSLGFAARVCLAIAAPACPVAAIAQGATPGLTLQQAIALAQRQGYLARGAVATLQSARARDRAFGARLLPQISLGGSVPAYNRSIIPVLQPDGSTLFKPQQETNSSLNMTVSQQLPFTGGFLSVSSRLAQVRRTGTTSLETWNSTPFSVALTQPILRANALGWDGRENELRSGEAEQQYLEAREDIALQTTDAFFSFYAARVALKNAESNLAINDTLFRLNQGRFEVGKIGENDLGQSELQLLRARAALDGAKLEHDRALAALRLALNIGPNEPLDVAVTSDVPEFDADTTLAVAQALRNRSQITDLALQDVQARRHVSEAKFNGGPGATLSASYGYNATASQMNLAYKDLLDAQQFQLSLSMPLVRWGAHSADIQAAQSDRERITSSAQATREQIAQETHFAALQLPLTHRQLLLAAKADTVAQKRYEVAYNRYVIGKIFINDLFIAQNDKDQSLLGYVQALRAYWTAYYKLRKLTLYDFEKGAEIR
jgi:outer membrane protein TolC